MVHRDRFVVARHHDDVVMRLATHRALLAEELEVGIWVRDERLVPKEVDGVEVAHGVCLPVHQSSISVGTDREASSSRPRS